MSQTNTTQRIQINNIPQNIRGTLLYVSDILSDIKDEYKLVELKEFSIRNINRIVNDLRNYKDWERDEVLEKIEVKLSIIRLFIYRCNELLNDILFYDVPEFREDPFNKNEAKELEIKIKKMGVYIQLLRRAYLDTTLILKYETDYYTLQDYNIAMENKPLIKTIDIVANKIKNMVTTLHRLKNN